MAPQTDLQRAFEALNGKLTKYNTLFAYADGDQPLKYSTERLHDAFGNITARFQQNWCSVVLDSALDRMNLTGWDVENETQNDALDDLWNELHLSLDSYDTHRDALITGEGYIIAWQDGDILDVYRNDPRMCQMFYDPERPKIKLFAAKWWQADVWHMTLYYPDRIEYYETRSKDSPSSANAFIPSQIPTASNPFGVIPVFHFRCRGELSNILTLQDGVNKLFADMMVTSEFSAWPQRWYITNGDVSAIKNAPYESQVLPAADGQGQNTQVGQFPAADLDNFLNAIDKIANSVAIISRTPKHYFYSAGGQISGEALLAMEAPLTKKVDQYQKRFNVTWQELGAFLLKLTGGGEIDENQIIPVWKPSESIQPKTEAETRKYAVEAGLPLITQLKREGWTEAEINGMLKDAEEENDRKQPVPDEWYDDNRDDETKKTEGKGQTPEANGGSVE